MKKIKTILRLKSAEKWSRSEFTWFL